MSLNKNQFHNLSNHYSRSFGTWKITAEQYEYLERHGNDSFYIFKTLYQFKSTLTDEKNNKFVYIIPLKKVLFIRGTQ